MSAKPYPAGSPWSGDPQGRAKVGHQQPTPHRETFGDLKVNGTYLQEREVPAGPPPFEGTVDSHSGLISYPRLHYLSRGFPIDLSVNGAPDRG